MREIKAEEIIKEYKILVEDGLIKENDYGVNTRIHLMFGKAQNNLKVGRVIFAISTNNKLKELLKLLKSMMCVLEEKIFLNGLKDSVRYLALQKILD